MCVRMCWLCVARKCFFKLFSFSFPSLLLPSLICTLTCSPWVDDFFLHYASTAADTPLLDLQVTLSFSLIDYRDSLKAHASSFTFQPQPSTNPHVIVIIM